MHWTHAEVLAQAETPCLHQEGSFSDQILAANNETNAETGGAQALFNGQRIEKWEPSSQINFSTQFWQRYKIYRRVKVKWRELGRVGGIFMTYLRTGVCPRVSQCVCLCECVSV